MISNLALVPFSSNENENLNLKSNSLFEKRTITDLSESELLETNGGSDPVAGAAAIGAAYALIQIGIWGYEFGKYLAQK